MRSQIVRTTVRRGRHELAGCSASAHRGTRAIVAALIRARVVHPAPASLSRTRVRRTGRTVGRARVRRPPARTRSRRTRSLPNQVWETRHRPAFAPRVDSRERAFLERVLCPIKFGNSPIDAHAHRASTREKTLSVNRFLARSSSGSSLLSRRCAERRLARTRRPRTGSLPNQVRESPIDPHSH